MEQRRFEDAAVTEKNGFWKEMTARQTELYHRPDEVRSPFARDYTRILHSLAYRRLKHKTQVFYNTDNDHICTRMEHVAHVESVSGTIAKHLGLNTELTRAIAMGHDLGHAPFGHHGEKIINDLSMEYLGKRFWHEQNGLYFVDNIELLNDNYNQLRNLDLTYAVRDGIISHCGEVDENGIRPRKELIDLYDFQEPGQYSPATWEGCVVKISDKVAYVGRDIEDAINLGFIDEKGQKELLAMARANDDRVMNTTVIMHNLIIDICENSNPDDGICLSERFVQQLAAMKKFNYEHIYMNRMLKPFEAYSRLVLEQIFEELLSTYAPERFWENIDSQRHFCPVMMEAFESWLMKYCDPAVIPDPAEREKALQQKNRRIYGMLDTEEIYVQAILDFISGMTDKFAIRLFQELLEY